jgi:hypothetical protein
LGKYLEKAPESQHACARCGASMSVCIMSHRLLRAAELPKVILIVFLMLARLRRQPSFNPAKFGDLQCN